MRFKTQAVLLGISSSVGEYNGRPYDSCTFFLCVDLPVKTTGETIGRVTRPFKFGTSSEINRWLKYKDKWPETGILVECMFEAMAGTDNSTKIVLVDLAPLNTTKMTAGTAAAS